MDKKGLGNLKLNMDKKWLGNLNLNMDKKGLGNLEQIKYGQQIVS